MMTTMVTLTMSVVGILQLGKTYLRTNPKHGTATAGIIGARANGFGIAGICPECKMLR